ncbi:MAG: hypothetical protein WCF67_14055 [Chitinophagaceae bacterium]
MSVLLDKCTEQYDKRNEFVAYEKGKTYKLYNRSKLTIRKVKVDVCFPQGLNERRCDYLMSCEEIKRAIFIELKGGGLTRALEQIYSTIIYIKADLNNYRFDARIVGKGDVPGFINLPDYKKLKKEIFNSGGTIERATNNYYSEEI